VVDDEDLLDLRVDLGRDALDRADEVADGVIGNHEDRDPLPGHALKSSSRVEIALGSAVLLLAMLLATASMRDNESRTLDLVRALAQGRLWIDPDAGNTVDRAVANGHVYAGGAPGLAFALLPFQLGWFRGGAAQVWLLTVIGAALPLALGAVGVRRAARAGGAS